MPRRRFSNTTYLIVSLVIVNIIIYFLLPIQPRFFHQKPKESSPTEARPTKTIFETPEPEVTNSDVIENVPFLEAPDNSKEFYAELDELQAWPPKKSRSISDYVPINIRTAIVEPTAFTEPPNLDRLLWIFVFTYPGSFANRRAIRETWGNLTIFNNTIFEKLHSKVDPELVKAMKKYQDVKITFLVGSPKNLTVQNYLLMESNEFGDILQEDFVDTYENQTVKTVFMLKHIKHNFNVRNSKFLAYF